MQVLNINGHGKVCIPKNSKFTSLYLSLHPCEKCEYYNKTANIDVKKTAV